jgi:hypothetical protein
MNPATIKIIQLNMGRSASVSDQLLKFCLDKRVDIALLQEPYTNRGRLTGFEMHPLRTFLCKGSPRRGQEKRMDFGAAIVVFNPTLRLFQSTPSTENFVAINIDNGPSNTVTLISGYFKYRRPTLEHLNLLESLLDVISSPVVISLDVNAFSKTWFSRVNDRRGALVDDFIVLRNLVCHNKRSNHSTFHGARGSTNIDVTLSSREIADNVSGWKIIPDKTSSDHRIISFTLRITLQTTISKSRRFNVDKADWDVFRSTFVQEIQNPAELISLSPNELAESLTKAFVKSASSAIPRRSPRSKILPPWWSEQLTEARKALRTSARVLRLNNCEPLRRAYNTCRNTYTRILRMEKKSTWKTFCSVGGTSTWGRLYKWLRGNRKQPSTLSCVPLPGGGMTQSAEETVQVILNNLIPNDPGLPFPELPPTQIITEFPPYTLEELLTDLSTISPNKAPGQDLITGKMIKRMKPQILPYLLNLTKKCLSEKTFPDIWKKADVVAILKDPKMDPANPKSFRPISLLPVLSKITEKAINRYLLAETAPNLSNRQYGFTAAKSAEDAIANLINWNQGRPEKYALTVFLDISGAFDNLNWSSLLLDLSSLGASSSSIEIISSFLRNRSATLTTGGVRSTVLLTRGCPQGSILGPTLWNVTMEALLKMDFPQNVNIQAYADDVALSVAADSRARLIRLTAEALETVLLWGNQRGLTFSATKSVAMVTKGFLVSGFTIPFGQHRIKTADTVKYLGILLDTRFNFNSHVEFACNKNLDLFSKLRGSFGYNWGPSNDNIMVLYKCVFVPRITYGSRFWEHATSILMNRKKLYSAQRRALLGISCAYKTASTEALQVLVGVLPLDLEINVQVARKTAKSLPLADAIELISNAEISALDQWQTRWTNSAKGRWSYSIFPDVRVRLSQPIWLNYHLSQFLTGHGDFNEKLASFNLKPSPLCSCNLGNESVDHVIFHCPRVSESRNRLELAVHRAGYLWPCPVKTFVSTKALYKAFEKFAIEALDRINSQ